MNIHHLELFYYVARHGGISEAVRNMPYGIHYEEPVLSVQQAWDVAAYIISKPHPPAPPIAAPELQ